MDRKGLRKVKEVNGWKVNHPHSFGNVFYAILTLIVVGGPLTYLFLPIGKLGITLPNGAFVASMQFTGLDLLNDFISFIRASLGQPASSQNVLLTALTTPEYSGNLLYQAVPYFNLIAAGILAFLFLVSIGLFVAFVVHIIKGFLRSSRVVRAFVIVDFILSLLFALMYLIVYFGYQSSVVGATGLKLDIWTMFYIAAGYLLTLIVMAITYNNCFKESIPECDLEIHDDSPTVEHLTKVHELTKIKYEGSSTLPPKLTSIGGHAFAENQDLIVANIPLEVTKLGNSAFANCLKLKVVSIPETVTEIGFNCFFNCVELERINYSGTKDNWKKIRRGSNWLAKAKTTEVTCIDGVIIVNPYH